jgi:hypothetical protein
MSLSLVLLTSLVGCGSSPGVPGIYLICSAVETEVSDTEILPLGFSVSELVADLEIAQTFDVDDEADSGGLVTIALARGVGTAVYVEYVDADGAPTDECAPAVSVPFDVELTTDDGAFDFQVSVSMMISEAATACIDQELALDTNEGSEAGIRVDAEAFRLFHCISPEYSHGNLALTVEGTDGNTMWSSTDTLFSWTDGE